MKSSDIQAVINACDEISEAKSIGYEICQMSDFEADEKNNKKISYANEYAIIKIYIRLKGDSLQYGVYSKYNREFRRNFITVKQLSELTELDKNSDSHTLINWGKAHLHQILNITSLRKDTHSADRTIERWKKHAAFFSEKKDHLSKMTDQEIIAQLKEEKFFLDQFSDFHSSLAPYINSCMHQGKAGLPEMEKCQQIINGATKLVNVLQIEGNNSQIESNNNFLKYYKPYYCFVTYAKSLEKQLENGKLLVTEKYVGQEFKAYWGILKYLETTFQDSYNLYQPTAYFARAIERRLFEIKAIQNWLIMAQSKKDLADSKISQPKVCAKIFSAFASFVLTNKSVKEAARRQEDTEGSQDNGYLVLKRRTETVIRCLLKEHKKIGNSNNQSPELEKFSQQCETMTDYLDDSPEISFDKALKALLDNSDQDGDLNVKILETFKSDLSLASPEIKQELDKVDVRGNNKEKSSIDEYENIPMIDSLFSDIPLGNESTKKDCIEPDRLSQMPVMWSDNTSSTGQTNQSTSSSTFGAT